MPNITDFSLHQNKETNIKFMTRYVLNQLGFRSLDFYAAVLHEF